MGSYRSRHRYTGGRSWTPLILILAAIALLLIAAVLTQGFGIPAMLGRPDPEHSVPPPLDSSSGPADSSGTVLPDGSQPGDSQPPAVSPTPAPAPVEPYVFGTPLEEGEPVSDDSAFSNAVFLGDSRTEGLQSFGGIKYGDYFWDRGMTVFHADSEEYAVFELNGEPATLVGMLSGKQYDAVYLMLGVNELGYRVSSYKSGLCALLDKIQEAQPDAVVYVQTMPPVNESKVESSGLGDWINNENVSSFNTAIAEAAAEKQVVLLDTASLYTGEDGQLPADATVDGVHFTVSGYSSWADYLRCHRMDPDRYFGNRSPAAAE